MKDLLSQRVVAGGKQPFIEVMSVAIKHHPGGDVILQNVDTLSSETGQGKIHRPASSAVRWRLSNV